MPVKWNPSERSCEEAKPKDNCIVITVHVDPELQCSPTRSRCRLGRLGLNERSHCLSLRKAGWRHRVFW